MIYVGCTNSSNQQFSLLIGTRVLGVTILHLPKESYINFFRLCSRNSKLVRYLVPLYQPTTRSTHYSLVGLGLEKLVDSFDCRPHLADIGPTNTLLYILNDIF